MNMESNDDSKKKQSESINDTDETLSSNMLSTSTPLNRSIKSPSKMLAYFKIKSRRNTTRRKLTNQSISKTDSDTDDQAQKIMNLTLSPIKLNQRYKGDIISSQVNENNCVRETLKEEEYGESSVAQSVYASTIDTVQKSSKSFLSVNNDNDKHLYSTIDDTCFIPMAYAMRDANFLNIPLANGLREVTDLIIRLNDNEKHFLEILRRYIKDDQFRDELFEHYKNFLNHQMETERRSYLLANEMWHHQQEFHKSNERTIEISLSNLTKKNRQLEEENEILQQRYNEIISKCDKQSKDKSSLFSFASYNNHKTKAILIINDKLRVKVSYLTSHLTILEKELENQHRVNNNLDEEIVNISTHMLNYKGMLRRILIDREMEEITLNNEIIKYEESIQESYKIGHLLIDDFNNMMKVMQSYSPDIHYSIAESQDYPCLYDLLQSCHLYATTISNHISLISTDSKTNETKCLRDENSALKMSVITIQNDKKLLEERLEKITDYEKEFAIYEKRIEEIKSQSCHNYDKLEQFMQELENEKQVNKSNNNYIEELRRELMKVEQEKNDMKLELKRIKSRENSYHRNYNMDNTISHQRLDKGTSLSNVNSAIETKTTEEVENLEEVVNNLLEEKEVLITKLNKYEYELQQEKMYTGEIDTNCLNLQEKLEFAQSTIQALQLERFKHLDEKLLLQSKVEQYNQDELNLKLIQNVVVNLTLENDKLNNELLNKTNEISKLDIEHNQYGRDKADFINEKNMLNKAIEDLHEKLRIVQLKVEEELQKNNNQQLEKREYEIVIQKQVKALRDKQKTERLAAKELLKDFNELMIERNKYEDLNNQYFNELKLLKEHAEDQCVLITDSKAISEEKSKIISFLEEKLQFEERELQNTYKKCAEDTNLIKKLDEDIGYFKINQQELEEVTSYLKSNIQKLQTDLDETRNEKQQLESLLEKYKKDNEINLTNLVDHKKCVEQLKVDNERLNNDNKQIDFNYKMLSTDNGLLKDNLKELNENYKNQINVKDEKIDNLMESNNTLIKQLEERLNDFENVSTLCNILMKENENLTENVNHENIENKNLIQAIENLHKIKDNLEEFKNNHVNCNEQNAILKEYIDELKTEMKNCEEREKANYNTYQNNIEILNRDFIEEREELQEELKELGQKYFELNEDMQEKNVLYSKLSDDNKALAGKLFKAIKMLIDEKCARQTSETQTTELNQLVKRLQLENKSLEERVDILNREHFELNTRIEELTQDKQNVIKKYENLEESYKVSILNGNELQKEINETKKSIGSQPNKECVTTLVKTKRMELHENKDDNLEEKLQQSYGHIEDLKIELLESHKSFSILEFKQCESVLHLHEINGKLETEEKLNKELMTVHENLLTKILDLCERGEISRHNCNSLLLSIRTNNDDNEQN